MSQAQLSQLQNMSDSQRQQLAAQMGIDLSSLRQQMNSSRSGNSQKTDQQTQYPVGTEFDEFGNPIKPPEEKYEEDEENDELQLYGIDIFESAPSTFSPVTNAPVPSNYIIGPGDSLRILLFGKENNEYDLSVNLDGNISIPSLGPIHVAGMSFSEAKGYVSQKVTEQMIGVQVSVTMGELRSIRVFVMGEVKKPGAYVISSLSTIIQSLYVSGGITDIASLRNIQLKRGGKLVERFDLYDLLRFGDSSSDRVLQDGDVVLVPAVGATVAIDGEVRRPAIYELKNEKKLNDVLALAGGVLPEAYTNAIGIQRYSNGKKIQVTADIESTEFEIQRGDEIFVSPVAPQVDSAVKLIGAVARPGNYQWKPGYRLADLLGDPDTSLLEAADRNYVLILRRMNDQANIEVLQADLAVAKERNIALQARDRVVVFSKNEENELGDFELDDLAFTRDVLTENEKLIWQEQIEKRLFWQQIGLEDEAVITQYSDEELEELAKRKLIELSLEEKEKLLELKNTTFFSRKRLLTPILAQLKEQASIGQPLQLVTINGEVKVPGEYPLARGATVIDLIKAAGGLTESSYSGKAEISRVRISEEGNAELEHIDISLAKVLANPESSPLIQGRDKLNILKVPDWQEDFVVEVKGEVKFPGKYSIRRGETLSELVRRVGGLTSYADAEAAIFTREDLKMQERRNLQRLSEELRKQIASESLRKQSGLGSMVSYDEAKQLLNDLTDVEAVGRLVINLSSQLTGNTVRSIVLKDGDTLYVPGRVQSVNVIGEVYVPSSHLYAENVGFEEYITRSGGYKNLADQEKTYIIRANGSVIVPNRNGGSWFGVSEELDAIQPGDTIVVPFDSGHMDNLTLWTNASQIVYQLAVATAAIGSL